MDPRQKDDAPISPADSRSAPTNETTNQSMDSVTGPIESLIRQIGIDKVYGEPITHGDTTVVPVADLRTGIGYGGEHNAEAGDGAGGGAALRLSPRGYVEIDDDGVRYQPIYSLSTVAIGGAFVGWLLYRLLSR